MLNNFIGGGQVFLHKIRMFQQVFMRTLWVSLIIGILSALAMYNQELKEAQWQAFYDYRKAIIADEFDGAINSLRETIGKEPTYITYVSIKTKSGKIKTGFDPRDLRNFDIFQNINRKVIQLGWDILVALGFFTALSFSVIFILWSRFGKNLKADKIKEGENKILTAKEVKNTLRKIGRASDLKIGDMPLVKSMETMNFLVSGSIGSGKTNLMHNMLPQIEQRGEPALVIDNTGEMIAKYYNPERGDIIFNPFDARGKSWDLWKDCSRQQELEKFADILIGFNSRKNNKAANDFWEQSAHNTFVACAELMKSYNHTSTQELYNVLTTSDVGELYNILEETNAAKYFTGDNARAASSIIAVLMSNLKPLQFLPDADPTNCFSIKNYTQAINEGNNPWLFLSTDPSSRELTQPLNASILELFIASIRKTRAKANNKIWVIIDELPSLGKLPGLAQLMAEGRKYGTCVLAGVQSTSQLYHHYGDAESSTLIGLFKTKFAFSSDDPRMGELYSKLCGRKTTISQQKNTSFGANEFRDGVSYNERSEQSPLIPYEDFGKLNIGECYVILPEISARVAKIQTPEAKIKDKNDWFIELPEELKDSYSTKRSKKHKGKKTTNDQPQNAEHNQDVAIEAVDSTKTKATKKTKTKSKNKKENNEQEIGFE